MSRRGGRAELHCQARARSGIPRAQIILINSCVCPLACDYCASFPDSKEIAEAVKKAAGLA